MGSVDGLNVGLSRVAGLVNGLLIGKSLSPNADIGIKREVLVLLNHLAQHVGQKSAVLVVFGFDCGVDA